MFPRMAPSLLACPDFTMPSDQEHSQYGRQLDVKAIFTKGLLQQSGRFVDKEVTVGSRGSNADKHELSDYSGELSYLSPSSCPR